MVHAAVRYAAGWNVHGQWRRWKPGELPCYKPVHLHVVACSDSTGCGKDARSSTPLTVKSEACVGQAQRSTTVLCRLLAPANDPTLDLSPPLTGNAATHH